MPLSRRFVAGYRKVCRNRKPPDPWRAGRSTGFFKLYANRTKSTIKKTLDGAQV
jgi:hypothetical protein